MARAPGLAEEYGHHFVGRLAVVKRRNQRLDDASRAVVSPRVSPRFKIVRRRDVPVAQRRRLVFVKPRVDAQRNGEQMPEPHMRILDARGKQIADVPFHYG